MGLNGGVIRAWGTVPNTVVEIPTLYAESIQPFHNIQVF